MTADEEKKDLVKGLIGYLTSFEAGVQKTVALFQEGNIDQAKKNTIEVIDGLGWIMEGVDVLHNMLNIDVSQLKGPLEQLQISLENDDDVMTADLFEQELLPTLLIWKQRMVDVDSQPIAAG